MEHSKINQELMATVNMLKTQLCQAENQIESFNAIFNELPGSVYLKDREGKYLLLNSQSRDQLKNQHGILANIIGKTDLDVFPKKYAKNYQKNDKEVLILGKTVLKEEEVELPNGKKLTQLST